MYDFGHDRDDDKHLAYDYDGSDHDDGSHDEHSADYDDFFATSTPATASDL